MVYTLDYNIDDKKIKYFFALLIILFILEVYYKNRYEGFANYKSNCSYLPRAITNALKKRNINKVYDSSWDYYLPCGYTRCENDVRGFKNEKTGKKIFMIDGCDWIASKAGLWLLLKKEFDKNAFYIMPETFILNDNKDIKRFKKFYKKKKEENKDCKFILKDFRQRQEGLKLANNLKDIINSVDDGYKIVQDFLENPFIISDRKINFRYYVLISCYQGQIKAWVYKDGFVYYTPKFFIKNSMDFKRTITTGYIDRKVYQENPLTVEDFRKYLGPEKAEEWDKEVINKLSLTVRALSKAICSEKKLQHHHKFQLFGADIAPDENLKATLMEINKGPDIGFKDDRDGNLKKDMVHDIFAVIDPVEEDEKHGYIRIF